MFRALWEYSRDAQDGGNNVALLYSVDEEWGMTGIRTFARKHYPGLGFTVKGAVVGEPTQLKTVVAHNGAVRCVVHTHGISAHSSNPANGKSAISDMARLIVYLEDEFIPTCDRYHPLTGKAQCSINIIHGGTASNVVPDNCEIQIDRRTVPGESTEEAMESFKKALSEFKKRYPASEVTWELSIDLPSFENSKHEAFSENVLDVMTGMGLDNEGIGVTYGTHAADLQKEGIPSVVLGPGDIGQAHTKDEWIDTSQLGRAVEVYKSLMMKL
jgi:acetylornithine deacetylase